MESVDCGETIGNNEKVCTDCKTSKTPLWRSGPAGPKSLCNACGIRYRKKRGAVGPDRNKEKQSSPSSSSCSTNAAAYTITSRDSESHEDGCGKNSGMSRRLRIKLVALGKEVVLMRRQRSPLKKIRRQKIQNHNHNHYKKLGEVEQAAFLLMSLSCGSVFA